MPGPDTETDRRREWLGVLATAPHARLAELAAPLVDGLAFGWVRRPEIGAVMVRGRTGGTGASFNLGEMTVTRASVQLDDGPVGHGYVQGRGKDAAAAAALIDALMQTDRAPSAEREVLAPLRREKAVRDRSRAAKAAATKVEFFTLVRGED